MQLCLGVFPIQSWCAEWLQQMAAKVRLGKCANIKKGVSGVLGLLCRLLWFDLDLYEICTSEQQGLIRGLQNSTTIPFTQGFNDRKR